MAMPDTSAPASLPRHGWTAAELLALPDDGHRYECIDGELFVSPSPRRLHQVVLWELAARLQPYIGAHGIGRLGGAPADVRLDARTLVQPDLYVEPAGIEPTASWDAVQGLLLVVEILSPSTALADRRLKRVRYQQARIPVYWIVDIDARLVECWLPEAVGPQIVDELLVWAPREDIAPFELSLPDFFAGILGGAASDDPRSE